MTENNDAIEIDGQAMSLADFAEVDMTNIEAVRFTQLAAGVFHFRCKDAGIKAVNGIPVVYFDNEVVNCFSAISPTIEPASLIGKTHQESFFIKDGIQDLGRVTAFLMDVGYTGKGTLTEMLNDFVGTEYLSGIKHRKDKNDPDRIFANLANPKPLPQEEVAPVATAGGLKIGG